MHWTKESDPRYGTVVVKGGNSKSVSMASLRLVTRVMNVVVVSTVATSLNCAVIPTERSIQLERNGIR